jgi:hypothetical protein
LKLTWPQADPDWRPLRTLQEIRGVPPEDVERRADDFAARGLLGGDRVRLVRALASLPPGTLITGRLLERKKSDFDRSVSEGKIIIFARSPTSAPFKVLPSDVWLSLTVSDWRHGVAFAPDGTVYSSIHYAVAKRGVDSQGRAPKVASTKAVLDEITSLYDEIEQRLGKNAIPNINETADQVQRRLKDHGVSASKRQIIIVAKDPSVAIRRRPVGRTIAKDPRSK